MIRKFLILVNYSALVFIVWAAILGYLIQRGQGFEIHFTISMISLTLTMIGHLGSAIYLTLLKVKKLQKLLLILLNYIATPYYLWATYAGWLIRQGQPFEFHLTISITSFFLSVSAHLLSGLFLITEAKQIQDNEPTNSQIDLA